jgi:GNAT superfamily N-acetyltransferase
MQIEVANTDGKILKCFDVLKELRPALTTDTYVSTIKGFISRGYHLIFIEEGGRAVAASGYRFTEHLHWGKTIYIDDLSTLPVARNKGYAKALLDFIVSEAKKNNCAQVHLDSGTNPQRYDAHRLYLRYGFNITSHHFALDVGRMKE